MDAYLKKALIILWVLAIIVSIIVVVSRHMKARERFKNLQFHGIVNEKTYLDVGKGLFIQVDGEWFELIDIILAQYINKGDSIYKYSSSSCLMVHRENPDNATFKFCDGYISKIENKFTLMKLTGAVKSGKIRTIRE